MNERERFEAWLHANRGEKWNLLEFVWEAWQAALAQRGEPAGWSGDPSTQDYASTQPEAQRGEPVCRAEQDAKRFDWIERRISEHGDEWATGVMRTAINRGDSDGFMKAIDAALGEKK